MSLPRLATALSTLRPRRTLLLAGATALLGLGLYGTPARAALAVGAKAPDFNLEAALGGKPFQFSLAQALKTGPVVVYFYPKAFTSGCTVEAHLFAEATPQFKALGATVIGVSNDDIATLKRFSTEACRDQFAVAADVGGKVIRQYDAGFTLMPGVADRISYVLSPQGQVLLAYSSLDPDGHVKATMEAVKTWLARNPR